MSDTHDAAATEGGQQHPLGIYLILTFMLLKVGFIMSIFMHMFWERMALVTAIIVPPMCLLVLIGIMSMEGWFTYDMRDN